MIFFLAVSVCSTWAAALLLEKAEAANEYSGQFYTVIPEVGNRRSDVKETVIPEPWKPWFLPL